MVGGSSQSAGSSGPARRGFEDKRKAVNSKDYEKPLPDVEHWREDPLHEVGSPRSPHKRGVDVFQRGVSPASPGGFSRAATPVDADHHAEHASIPMDFMDRALHSLFAVAARCGMMNCVRGMLPCLGYAVPSAAERLQRKWYRVHPITDELYFVRPDYGMAGRVAGPDAGEVHGETGAGPDDGTAPVRSAVKDNAFRAVKSMGVDSMRRVGLGDPAMDDSFVNMCKLCYDNKVEVVDFLANMVECARHALEGRCTADPFIEVAELAHYAEGPSRRLFGCTMVQPSPSMATASLPASSDLRY
eukprot:CAMPEP_0178388678 /NCGR_PEP_ID=MMETSP0689_2-20121128/9719_1 /TAXON_ID=160604 /ORGANISM="Amphidinium massartii, Strain CS-259" /LENGTH=300 /DNA_ID=CAMNT_0020009093 /DNA_START=61 /DNA_END=964 /DNA_ORIENTATION=+